MDQSISAAEANRSFSRILRDVQHGDTFVVTSHGRPVARIVPFSAESLARAAAWARLMAGLENRPAVDIGPWSRDDLYDE